MMKDYGTLQGGLRETAQVSATIPPDAVCSVYRDNVTISGCWFHHSQALTKCLKKLELSDAYKNYTQRVLGCILSLPLLPVADIKPVFKEAKIMPTTGSASQTNIVSC